jgi:hypothetical protein
LICLSSFFTVTLLSGIAKTLLATEQTPKHTSTTNIHELLTDKPAEKFGQEPDIQLGTTTASLSCLPAAASADPLLSSYDPHESEEGTTSCLLPVMRSISWRWIMFY